MNKASILPLRRRLEQGLVKLAMTVLAWLLEKAVLQSIKRGGTNP